MLHLRITSELNSLVQFGPLLLPLRPSRWRDQTIELPQVSRHFRDPVLPVHSLRFKYRIEDRINISQESLFAFVALEGTSNVINCQGYKVGVSFAANECSTRCVLGKADLDV